MTPYQKAMLPPRILVLIGIALIALKVFLKVDLLPDPIQTTLGGVLALIGLIWFVVGRNKFKQ